VSGESVKGGSDRGQVSSETTGEQTVMASQAGLKKIKGGAGGGSEWEKSGQPSSNRRTLFYGKEQRKRLRVPPCKKRGVGGSGMM